MGPEITLLLLFEGIVATDLHIWIILKLIVIQLCEWNYVCVASTALAW